MTPPNAGDLKERLRSVLALIGDAPDTHIVLEMDGERIAWLQAGDFRAFADLESQLAEARNARDEAERKIVIVCHALNDITRKRKMDACAAASMKAIANGTIEAIQPQDPS